MRVNKNNSKKAVEHYYKINSEIKGVVLCTGISQASLLL